MTIRYFVFLLSLTCFGAEEVVNGKRPTGSPMTLIFEEELRLGPDSGEEDHFLWNGAGVAVELDQKGNIYLVDPVENRVVAFDKTGRFQKIIGGAGQGPGQFQALNSMSFLNSGGAIAFDSIQGMARFHYFDGALKFERKREPQNLGMFFQYAMFAPSGKYYAAMFMVPKREGIDSYVRTGIFDTEFKPQLQISETVVDRFQRSQLDRPGWWAEFIASWLRIGHTGIGLMAFTPDGYLYTATTDNYEITYYDPELKPLRTIKREYRVIPLKEDELDAFTDPMREVIFAKLPSSMQVMVTPAVIRRAIELAEFPPRKPPIFGLIPMEDNGLLVVHDYNPKTGETRADIFDRTGKFIGTTRLPDIPVNLFGGFFGNPAKMTFRHGKAYAIVDDEDDNRHLVRYSYRLVPASSRR
ncbi:MAG: 6-bladed beta-propeller [Acidobacteriota bacterium]|nr:6-bladed beta-propeller [Acidobacteriota bacterium]